MMKKIQGGIFSSILCGAFSTMMFPGCTGNHSAGKGGVSVDSVPIDTTVYLDAANPGSPNCQIKLCFKYLKSDPYDSLTQVINQTLEEAFFSAHAGMASPQAFVSAIKESLVHDYLKDVEDSYQADVKNGMKADEIPNWYNYEFEIRSQLEGGKDNIWNYSVTTFQYTGGAHPNTWARWVNVDARDGHGLTKEEVFQKGADEEICKRIFVQLLADVNRKLETDTLTCLEGLNEVGVLLDTDLYIPDNFLLGKKGVTFLYNTYDIAPYYMGRFELTVPYKEIDIYLNKK
ncbi:DUF3298 domain-containing protein [Phocaeicola sp.]|uniref:DUF3298 and DUF4163 domain-containing protein n=1 Tax=Phocaeicola sp. TaxID=2773926 RepID=UPI002845A6B8|nr:DUF3298 domain-containing protein [Phocaeicola sp.]MDR3793976.1 DUF3298 domain-containing protein [Phocaeicola sp.]